MAELILSCDNNYSEDLIISSDDVLILDPDMSTTITTNSNIIVEGILRSRPSSASVMHIIEFRDVDEEAFVGGHTNTPIDTDVGLWVLGTGQLDIEGSRRVGWNRTGTDTTWHDNDVLRKTPISVDVYQSQIYDPLVPLETVSSPSGHGAIVKTYTQEVFNLTRNVIVRGVQGRAHVIFLMCNHPQHVKWAAFNHLGPQTGEIAHGQPVGVMGCYPFHLHRCGEGVRGSFFEGLVVSDSGHHAFVPHASHGVTFYDCIAHKIHTSAFWWDADEETHDCAWDNCLATDLTGWRLTNGFTLGEGVGNRVTNSVAAGGQSNIRDSAGFHWPERANGDRNLWLFEGNVSHNNRAEGISTWQNDGNLHTAIESATFRNRIGLGVGAYRNRYSFRQIQSFENEVSDLDVHAVGEISFIDCTFGKIRFLFHRFAINDWELVQFINGNGWHIFGPIIMAEQSDRPDNQPSRIEFRSVYWQNDLDQTDFNFSDMVSEVCVRNVISLNFTIGPP